jgi:hypothetical protein
MSLQYLRTPKQVTVQLSALATKSPLQEHVGNAPGHTSLASVHQLATEKARVGAEQYQKNVINYAIEWEQIVTTRVDEDLKKTNALQESLNHYQNKIAVLRKKVNAVENKGKGSPTKLSEKLTRNEGKLEQAWKLHEEGASTLCNLLDEITKGGWKDLYPLVLAALQWELGRTTEEHDVYAKLSEVEKDMTFIFDEKASVPVVEQRPEEPSGGSSPSADAAGEVEKDVMSPFDEKASVPVAEQRAEEPVSGSSPSAAAGEVEKDRTSPFDKKMNAPVVEQHTEEPSGGSSPSTDAGDAEKLTTGSFHPPGVVSVSSSDEGDHDVKTAESPKVH